MDEDYLIMSRLMSRYVDQPKKPKMDYYRLLRMDDEALMREFWLRFDVYNRRGGRGHDVTKCRAALSRADEIVDARGLDRFAEEWMSLRFP